MTTPFPFTTGQVLTAAQMNAITTLPINDQTASYVLVVGDVGKRVVMNSASATTITVNNSVFSTGDTIFLASKGAGTCTVTAGAGVTINVNGSLALTQYGGGTLVALSASTFVFFPAGVKNTLSVDFLLVGGGGAGGSVADDDTRSSGGGGGGGFVTGSGIIGKTTYTVKVGAGGAKGSPDGNYPGMSGTASAFINTANGGGAGGSTNSSGRGVAGQNGASGGGGGSGARGAGGSGVSGEGNNGGASASNNTAAGGGGGAASTGGAGATTTGGNGGTGSTNNYTGSTITYAAGGGGGASVTAGTGTANVSGAGATSGNGNNGSANRGGGGGGTYGTNLLGGNGGSGAVVIRYLTADAAGLTISATGTYTTGTDGSYTWYSYTATGTLVVA